MAPCRTDHCDRDATHAVSLSDGDSDHSNEYSVCLPCAHAYAIGTNYDLGIIQNL